MSNKKLIVYIKNYIYVQKFDSTRFSHLTYTQSNSSKTYTQSLIEKLIFFIWITYLIGCQQKIFVYIYLYRWNPNSSKCYRLTFILLNQKPKLKMVRKKLDLATILCVETMKWNCSFCWVFLCGWYILRDKH